jgi:SAM-dependent methyltransferase
MPERWDAEGYARDLQRGLAVSGESAEHFARERARRVRERLARWGLEPRSVLEFGCGTGTNLRFLREVFPASRLVGLEPSAEMREQARRALAGTPLELLPVAEFREQGSVDLVFVNGVFHHIPPPERARELARLRGWLAPGGALAVFENNPFNPGARWVMRRIPFDRDAVMVDPFRLRSALRDLGLVEVEARFYFVVPRWLRALRPLEAGLERWPLGAQYAVYGRAPA